MDLVDEQDGVGPLAQLAEQRLETFLEVAAVLGTGQQRTKIQRIHDAIAQQIGYLIIDDPLRQPFGDSRLADARLTDQQRVVLATPRQDLCDPLDLVLAADQRIDPPLPGQLVQVAGIGVQRIAGSTRLAAVLVLHVGIVLWTAGISGDLGNAMSDVIDDIDTRNVLLLEQENRLAFLLAEDGDQDIGTGDFTLARALHMEYGTLQNSLEPQGGLGFALFIVLWNKWCGGINEFLQVVPELVQARPAGPQYGSSRFIVQ